METTVHIVSNSHNSSREAIVNMGFRSSECVSKLQIDRREYECNNTKNKTPMKPRLH